MSQDDARTGHIWDERLHGVLSRFGLATPEGTQRFFELTARRHAADDSCYDQYRRSVASGGDPVIPPHVRLGIQELSPRRIITA